LDPGVADSFYQDNAALFSVTIQEKKLAEAVPAIRNLIGNDNAMTGSDVSLALAMQSGVAETGQTIIFAVRL
jgi:hypothetical protein